MTNAEKFREVFGYEPATDAVVCNKEDWCGASEPCKYCTGNANAIGREEDWWNSEYPCKDLVVGVKLASTCEDCIINVLRPKVRKIIKRKLWRDGAE